MQLETATNTRTLAFWCPATFHGHPISPQSPLKHTKSLDYFTSLCMCSGGSVSTKKMLYHLYDRSQLVYCLQVWCLSLVKEMKTIEDVQRLATKFILNDYVSDYRTRQLKLHILPLSMLDELNDTCLFVKSLNKHPTPSPSQIMSLSVATTLDLVHIIN